MEILNLAGLILSFVGTLLVTFSVIKNPGEAYQEVKGKKFYLASIILNKFRWGVGILAIGFLLQLISSI